MARIHTGLKSAKFEKPDRIQSVTVCSETGKKATTGCPHTNLEYFLWFTTPDLCDKHHGKEVQNTKKDSTESENKEIIQGITNEIDEKEPPRTNNHTTNSMVTQDENKKQNETMNNNTNQMNTTNTTENQTSDNHNTTNSNVNQNTTSNMNTENTNITLNTTTNDTEL